MSRHRLWVFVQGPLDRAFFSHLCLASRALTNIPYTIALPQEAPEGLGDGKTALLGLYRHLRRIKSLVTNLNGKVTRFLFLLAKDIDDLLGKMARSQHVVYTKYYFIENYLFRHGEFAKALSSAARLDVGTVSRQLGKDPVRWTRKVAANWKPWVKYCVLVSRLKTDEARNFGANTSRIHPGPYAKVQIDKQRALYEEAFAKSGLLRSRFAELRRRVGKQVDSIYSRGEHDSVFNGKWYRLFAAVDALVVAGGRKYQKCNLEERILDCLMITLDYSAP